MILDFSPMKKTVIEEGGLAGFVKFTHSDNAALKLNSVWSLKNLLYSADSEIKRTVMQQLGYGYLIELLNDSSLEVQEQALDLVRNLACGTKEVNLRMKRFSFIYILYANYDSRILMMYSTALGRISCLIFWKGD
jgi:hypothetical protein